MSLLKMIKAQLGLSVTPANNFTWDASSNGGATPLKLTRGDAVDIMTVDAAGKVGFSIGILGFTVGGTSPNFFIQTPTWLGNFLFNFGSRAGTPNANGVFDVTFASNYPTASEHWGVISFGDDISGTVVERSTENTVSYVRTVNKNLSGAPITGAVRINYVRFGKAA